MRNGATDDFPSIEIHSTRYMNLLHVLYLCRCTVQDILSLPSSTPGLDFTRWRVRDRGCCRYAGSTSV